MYAAGTNSSAEKATAGRLERHTSVPRILTAAIVLQSRSWRLCLWLFRSHREHETEALSQVAAM